MTRARRPFETLPPAQQAGMLCNDARFQQFVGARIVKSGATCNATACAEYIRRQCKINSRKELNTSDGAAAQFQKIRTDFDAWRGRIGKPR